MRERKYRTLKIEFDNSGGLVAGDLENNGNYPTFSVDKSKGTARLKGSRLTDTYVLKGFHVHFGCENDRGSEHTRNGRRYSGEVIRCYTRFLSKGEFLVIFLFHVFPQITQKFTFWFVEGTRGLSFSPNAQFRSLLKFQYSLAELLLSFQVHFLFEDPSGWYAVVAFWLRVNTVVFSLGIFGVFERKGSGTVKAVPSFHFHLILHYATLFRIYRNEGVFIVCA